MAIAKAGGIPLLVEVVESGSQRGKETAASILMQLCLNSPKFCTLVLQEGAGSLHLLHYPIQAPQEQRTRPSSFSVTSGSQREGFPQERSASCNFSANQDDPLGTILPCFFCLET
ncbi:hypothetical protein NC653_022226 [Populus alba x Populus x berolinensis]|uniref:Uncharacterized protein n=1 Tax=Populus alba x Populus x berolinensis TaxID=444605 RepID=A0AAD6MFN5_9ROSI|nr:hypothetical protein NC653_022226 [Populus alba x Populus x berolinensis]